MTNTSELITQFNSQIVFFSQYRKAYAMMAKAVNTTKIRQVPNCCVVAGPSGVGKSTLAQLYRDSFPAPNRVALPQEGIRQTLPAFYFCVPSAVTVKSFVKALLAGLGCSDQKGDTVDLVFRATALLKTREVEVCLLDEIQRLTRPNAQYTKDAVIDCLVTLLNYTNIPIILLGTKECLDLVYSREILARRYPYRMELGYLTYSEDSESDYFQLLRSLDIKLYDIANLATGAHLTDDSIASGLFTASRGSLEYIKKITCEALDICLNRDAKLRRADFASACESMNLSLSLCKDSNPFKLSVADTLRALENYSESSIHSSPIR